MKNILLTGSGGFIGSNLKNYFDEYNLFCPRSREFNLLNKYDVEDYIAKNGIEFIIHSASCGVRISPDASIEDVAKPNIEMFKNLADIGIPMINFGSGAEYDKSKALKKVKESDFGKSIPKDPYGYSKYMISKEIENLENVLNLRIFGIYGYGEDFSRVTSCILNSKLKNEPVVLRQNVRFSFIYIDDFCKIVKHFVEHPAKGKFLNTCSTESIEILELAKIMDVEVILENEGLNREYTADNALLLNELGKFEFTDYKEGMDSFYQKLVEENNNGMQ